MEIILDVTENQINDIEENMRNSSKKQSEGIKELRWQKQE